MSQLKSSIRTSLSVEIPPNYSFDLIDSINESNDGSIFSDDDIMFSHMRNREQRSCRKHHTNEADI